ncbi:hypothetical protein FJY68_03390 [candidate division WOR-3 bacterium]|uniref:Uncharacterized protein n=1 Tax=candidate division WOR-3 bacterium TaxID=2052148 RepID=A0A937XGY6_UNCW3|nr:hypothetical protein [candidate division WOR-3 bacterium]
MPREPSGPFKLGLQVSGAPVRLGDAFESEEWRKALAVGSFSRASLVESLRLGAGLFSGAVYSARNQELLLFSGKVFVAPDLGDGPMKFSTSVAACFHGGSLSRLRADVTGNMQAASRFAGQCKHALTRLLGEPSQRRKDGSPVWWGSSDRITLFHSADHTYLVHELTARK